MRRNSLLTLFFLFIVGIIRVHAESITVSLSVGDTYFAVNGYTMADSLVTLKENGSVKATVQSDSNGYFDLETLDADGLHTYDIFAIDPLGRFTDTVTQTVSLTAGNTTTIGNLIMPPTVSLDNSSPASGTDIHLAGYSVPGAAIQIFLNDTLMTTGTGDSVGAFMALISTTNRRPGTYTVFARTSLSSGYNSINTTPLTFVVLPTTQSTQSSGNNPESSTETSTAILPQPSASVTVSPSPKPVRPWWIRIFDTDANGILALEELKNVMLSWVGSWTKHKSGTCDLNDDKICDLTDLSILLYYIGR